MSTLSPSLQDGDTVYEVCSIASSTETADNLPGPGRLLGNLYSYLGVRLENGLGRAALQLHGKTAHGPPLQHDGSPSRVSLAERSTTSRFDALSFLMQSSMRPPSFQDEYTYEVCSIASSTETADNLPGPGRLLGNLYSSAGIRIVNRLCRVAVQLGRGPEATALKIRAIKDDPSLGHFSRRKELKKKCNRLARYTRSNITSTQEQALDRIIELGIADDHIRELLEESALNTITSFREDPLVWYALDPSLQKRAQKAITALSDSRIRYLVEGALANREHMFDGIFSELVAYLLNSDYSFLVIRYLRIQILRNRNKTLNIYLELLQYMDKLDNDQISVLEKLLEWEEFDKTLEVFDFAGHHPQFLDMTFRHAEELPGWVARAQTNWVADLESNDLDRLTHAFVRLHDFLTEVKERKTTICSSLYVAPWLMPLRRVLENPLGFYLAVICDRSDSAIRPYAVDNELTDAYVELAQGTESKDLYFQERAISAIRIALSMNRYVRNSMSDALSSTSFIRTTACRFLLEETARLCMPRKRAERLSLFFRHYDENGRLVHLGLSYAKCNGECGATDEHLLRYVARDTTAICIDKASTFLQHSHYPLVAGRTPDGELLYLAKISARKKKHYLAIPNGIRQQKIKLKVHYADGTEKSATSSIIDGSMKIPVLAYDPESYKSSGYYASRREFSGGMDATGPFSWKFNRKLSKKQKATDGIEFFESVNGKRGKRTEGVEGQPEDAMLRQLLVRAPEIEWVQALIDY